MKNLKEVKTLTVANEHLRYILTAGNRPDGSTAYGVKVISTLFGEEEQAAVYDITSDKASAEKFLALLADNTVLPSTLTEIAEDYVASCFTV